eukprot:TRINITY_DN107116_c0_g1_i1.p1 TRINITY_DN107116_c0_g1~~TRINITY_DN107116_c0_g1_i1.p1  ORF type:complete len:425 (-),score=112.19 TRINITY_DN107116_c0_g1_i1:21-1247(-)
MVGFGDVAGETKESDDEHFKNFAVLHESKEPAVLVLGGSKFMGKACVEDLLLKKARVCTVNRGCKHWGTSDPAAGRTARVFADREERKVFTSRLQEATRRLGGSWDMVIDFSAFDGDDMQVSLEGLGSAFKLYVYVSSDSIYEVGKWSSEQWKPRKQAGGEVCVVEEDGVRPADKEMQEQVNRKDSYGHGKLEGEEVLRKGLPEGCRSLVLRLPDVIGPYDATYRLWAYWHWLRAGEEGASPPQVQSYKRQRATSDDEVPVPKNPKLSVVYSRDVARFIVSLLEEASRPADVPDFDVVNVACLEQVPLCELLCQLSTASGGKARPRFEATKDPKSYLPSVDRPWPLSLHRMTSVYGFKPTPLEEVLKLCAAFFSEGCTRFPHEARKAAKKLQQDPQDAALSIAGLIEE